MLSSGERTPGGWKAAVKRVYIERTTFSMEGTPARAIFDRRREMASQALARAADDPSYDEACATTYEHGGLVKLLIMWGEPVTDAHRGSVPLALAPRQIPPAERGEDEPPEA